MKTDQPSRKPRIRIVIADDHPVVREGLRALLKTQPDIEVVAEAANGREAVEQFLSHRPDLLLLDLRMPQTDGFAVIPAILEKTADAKIIVMTVYNAEQDIQRALQAGAKAYLLKDSPPQELLKCIREVQAGRKWIPPAVGARIAGRMQVPRLTKREMEIVRMMATGKTNKEIGSSLGISDSTVKVHLRHIFKKLGATGRVEALRISLERGIAHLDNDFEI